METNFVTAIAATFGSILGAAASIGTTWINQRTQTVRAQTEGKLRDRGSLYGEFITEASRLTVEAMGHSLEQLNTLLGNANGTQLFL